MKTIKSLFIYGITVLVCLFGIELYLRSAEIELSYHKLDRTNGKMIQKDKRIVMLKEGFYLGRSNEFGYLGPGYPMEKENDVFRIALMGDSYTEGLQLFERYHFRSILESKLKEITGQRVEVLNFGSGNFIFSDMYCYYHNYARQFNPDLVIYSITPRSLKDRPNYFIPSPYYYLEGDSIKFNFDFREGKVFKTYQKVGPLMENSSFVKMANNVYKLVSKGRAGKIILDKFYFGGDEQVAVATEESKGPVPTLVRERYNMSAATEKVLGLLGQDEKVFIAYREEFPADLDSLVTNTGAQVIRLTETLDSLKSKGIDPHFWKATGKFGHWNHKAHQAVGEHLANTIEPIIQEQEKRYGNR